ncbi:hypothetical protein BN961_01717 [Afipia felis]|uniref:Uncharacterized protein n=1 Tax=Afipia felis TaxID=1035 RepID=A0A090N7B3_AFIFE|nr:hypothetical protein BN961_01717 [Afipia felis]
MQHVELRRIGQQRISRKTQAANVTHGVGGLAVEMIGGVRHPREDLERTGEVDLVEALE